MQTAKIIRFFRGLCRYHLNQVILFEERGAAAFTQMVSPLLSSQQEAEKLCDEFKTFFPTVADTEIVTVKSTQVEGLFRVLIVNPMKIFVYYVNEIKEMLNTYHPLPPFRNSQGQTIKESWTVSTRTNDIIYQFQNLSITHSLQDLKASQEFNEYCLKSDDDFLQRLAEYNENLTAMYPGLVITLEALQRGDGYYISDFTYENYQALLKRRTGLFKNPDSLFFKPEPNDQGDEDDAPNSAHELEAWV
ncbi:MAG: hypothetical protein A3F46_04540 [Legionellales bacterium RIFCSPHIGHO2_12_FULL_42_9]|nr:MAG: hypothetical protein A3F46_04540 [Legionellales bacterium RIFCSPHIGHO2_12_FULL_42_9]